jgi:hypothetical protein
MKVWAAENDFLFQWRNTFLLWNIFPGQRSCIFFRIRHGHAKKLSHFYL